MHRPNLLRLVVHLVTIGHSVSAPLKIPCPKACHCSGKDVRCSTLVSLANTTNSRFIDELILDGCSQELLEIQLKVEKLVTKCDRDVLERYYLPLFATWAPILLIIENTQSNNKTIIYERPDGITDVRNCFDVCKSAGGSNVTSTTLCICATSTSTSPSLPITDVNVPTSTLSASSITMIPLINGKYHAPKSASIFDDKNFALETTLPSHVSVTYSSNNTGNIVASLLNNGSSMSTNNTNTTQIDEEKNQLYFITTIGALSCATFLMNFLLVVHTCVKNQPSVIDSFGVSLMLFNILLAVYGGALALYLYRIGATNWDGKFCQGFTSIKLFGMGATVWTLMLLTYHHGIKVSTPEETDAIYKSIVLILEGLMLSGVLAVMSWIKLDKWGYLCVIFEPSTTVEWMLTGIELLYYFIAIMLIIRYPIHEFLKRNRKKTINDKKKPPLNGNFPIFFMVLFCFCCWVGGYIITQPWAEMFLSHELNAAIRVCSVIFPHLICPVIYSIRNTFCCVCQNNPCVKKEKLSNSSDHSMILHCECDDDDTCSACLDEPMIQYENTLFFEQQPGSKNNGKLNRRKNAVYNNNRDGIEGCGFVSPKAIVRSPVMSSKQRFKTLKNVEDNTKNEQMIPLLKIEDRSLTQNTKPSIPNTLALSTECTYLLDDTDGNSQKPPKATSESTPIKALIKQESTLNSPSDYPSFISIDAALDVATLPRTRSSPQLKPAVAKQQSKDLEEVRKSRGPTFYPLDEQIETEPKNSKRKPTLHSEKSKFEGSNKCAEPNKSTKRRRKKKKGKPVDIDVKRPTHSSPRSSTISLEWDHSYSYSDSSGSSASVMPADEVKTSPTATTTATTTPTPTLDVDTKCKLNNATTNNNKHPDHVMEWDPSACEIKLSPKNQAKDANVDMKYNKTKTPVITPEKCHPSTPNLNGKVSKSP